MSCQKKKKTLTPWYGFENVKATKQIPGPIITCSHKYKPTTLTTDILNTCYSRTPRMQAEPHS